MSEADQVFDFVIVGSGAASVCAALAMQQAGKSAIIVEKSEHFGGSTALSGGVAWVPNNPLQQEAGVEDSPEMARTYIGACAGPPSRSSSEARRDAFIREAPKAIAFLRDQGMKLVHAEGYSDYHETEYPGGVARSRSLVPEIFDLKKLGEHAGWIEWSPEFPPTLTHEVGWLTLFGRGWKSKAAMAKVGLRLLQNKLLRRRLVGIGMALQGRLLQLALKARIPIWLNAPVTELTSEDGRVTGVVVRRHGREIPLRAERGVLLNSGGFARNPEMREKYLEQPTSAEWTVANPGDTGEVQHMAMRLGAAVENMDLCWWIPGTFPPEGGTSIHVFEAARPHAIIVDQHGQRYTNEATSYVQVGVKMYERNKTVPAVPSWLILESRHRKRYPFGTVLPGRTPQAWFDSGYMKQGETIADLARQCELDPATLQATIERFNGFAREGVDHDYHRGRGAYPRYLGDPSNKPNPSLGPVEKAPFYAVKVYPRDVGTCGGLVTDEFARVLNTDDQVVPGLYACGNATSSLFNASYPGAGASIGASLAFGYIAARHAAGVNER